MLAYGCVLPAPRKIKGPDLHTVQVGLTTREELARIIGTLSTNVSEDGFFWARWKEDLPLYAATWGGYGSERPRKIVNVLALFDSGGILAHYQVCSERRLLECLSYFAARSPSKPGITEPLTFAAYRSMWWSSANLFDGRFAGSITFDKSKIALHKGNCSRRYIGGLINRRRLHPSKQFCRIKYSFYYVYLIFILPVMGRDLYICLLRWRVRIISY
jgi:hypothetical protein